MARFETNARNLNVHAFVSPPPPPPPPPRAHHCTTKRGTYRKNAPWLFFAYLPVTSHTTTASTPSTHTRRARSSRGGKASKSAQSPAAPTPPQSGSKIFASRDTCDKRRGRGTVKFPAVVTKVTSKAGGGLISPHSRGVEAQMLASDSATQRKAAVAATTADK